MIVLQTLRHRRPPRQPLRPTRLHFRFFPYRTFQARSADAYISSGRTGRPYRPTSGSSLSYGTATFYPLIPRRHSPRIHPVYPTLLLTALPGHVSPHTATSGQAGYRGDSTLDPRFLQPDLPRTQEIRRLEARHRPQRPQQVSTLSTLPHGDVRLYHAFSTARSLGHLAGLQGRLLSRPSCTRTSTLPQLPVRSPLLPVPGPPFRPGDVTVPLHPPSQGSRGLCQEPGPLLAPLSGRLEHLGPLSPSLHGLDLVAPHPIRATRPSRQHGQVRASAVSTFCVRGHRLRPGQRDRQTGSAPSAEPSALSTDLHVAQGPSGRQVAATSRPYDFPGETHSTGPSPHAPPSVRSQGQLGPVVGSPLYTGAHPTGHPLCSAVVGFPPQLTTGGPPTPPPPPTSALHRRFYRGMGSSSDVPSDFRHVVPSAEVSAHKQSGTASGSPRTSALPAPGHQQGRDSDDGQHHSCRSDQEPGRHTLTILVPPDCTPPRVGGQQTHHPGPAPQPGTSERGGRSIVPATSDHQLRVDTVSTDTPPRVAPVGPASCRPLCHFGNRPPAHVRLSTPGPGSVEDRRLVLSMDGSVGLHVSSLPAHSGGAPEDTGVQLPRRPSGPSVAISTLVSPSTVSARRSSETPTSTADAIAPTSVPDLSPGPVTPLSARLEAIKSALVSRGYSSTVATRITASHRLSTQSVYDSKWRIFTEWCRDTGHDPFSTSTPVLADFLAFLFTAKGFAPTTIAGYRTTIINTLEKVTGHRLADEHLISSLLNQFESERPRPGQIYPRLGPGACLARPSLCPIRASSQGSPLGADLQDGLLDSSRLGQASVGASHLLLPSSTPRRLVQRHLSSGPPLRGQDRARQPSRVPPTRRPPQGPCAFRRPRP